MVATYLTVLSLSLDLSPPILVGIEVLCDFKTSDTSASVVFMFGSYSGRDFMEERYMGVIIKHVR